MMPATNKGAGQNMGFPDNCTTPAAPSPIMLPYMNMGPHAMAMGFSLRVKLTMMAALSMAAKILMTCGMEPAVIHPLFKGIGAFIMGNPIVSVDMLPAINLLCPTTGNNMNNPVGAVQVPSVTNVSFTSLAATAGSPGAASAGAYDRAMHLEDIEKLQRATDDPASVNGRPMVCGAMLERGIGYVRVATFPFDLPTRLHNELRRTGALSASALILDLRDNPGGETDAATRLTDDFLERGTPIARMIDGDGDETLIRANQTEPYGVPLVLLVNARTGSAAELFAGSLQEHGRAVLVGRTTYGKGAAQQLVPDPSGGAVYATVGTFALPGGGPIEGVGVRPDIEVGGDGSPESDDDIQLEAALRAARRLIRL